MKTFGVLDDFREGGKTFVKALFHIIEKSDNYDEIAFCLMTGDNQAHRLTQKHAESHLEYALFTKSF